ncbi:hypothetical protein D9M72_32880 [compost metagenome]
MDCKSVLKASFIALVIGSVGMLAGCKEDKLEVLAILDAPQDAVTYSIEGENVILPARYLGEPFVVWYDRASRVDEDEAKRIRAQFASHRWAEVENPPLLKGEALQTNIDRLMSENLAEAAAYKMLGTPSGIPASRMKDWMHQSLAWELNHPQYRKNAKYAPTAALN